MNLKFWEWGKKKTPAQPPRNPVALQEPACLTIYLDPDGRLDQYAYFPPCLQEEAHDQAKNFALMLFLLNSGKLVTTLQRAVAAGGEDSRSADGFSHLVLSYFNALVVSGGQQEGRERVLVRARETFGWNLGGGGK